MSILSMIISLGLLIPFFGWGVYTLRARYQHHEEMHRFAEWGTVAAALTVFAVEMSLLRAWMTDPWLYAGTALGLALAMVALYGHVMISVASSVFVEALMPNMDSVADTPQFGPAEALERMGEYDSALQEYLVIARIFPRDTETSIRIAKLLLKVDRVEESVKAYERAFNIAREEDQALGIANRLNDLYRDRLGAPDKGEAILKKFLKRYPQSKRTESVVRRMGRKTTPSSVDRVRKEIASVSADTPEVELEAEGGKEIELAAEEPTAKPAIAASRIPDSTWEGPAPPEPTEEQPPPEAAKAVPDKGKRESSEGGLSLDWSTADEPESPKDRSRPEEESSE